MYSPVIYLFPKICTFNRLGHFWTDRGADRVLAICAKCKIREYSEFGRSRQSDRNSIICIAPCFTFRLNLYISHLLTFLGRLWRRLKLCHMCKVQSENIQNLADRADPIQHLALHIHVLPLFQCKSSPQGRRQTRQGLDMMFLADSANVSQTTPTTMP